MSSFNILNNLKDGFVSGAAIVENAVLNKGKAKSDDKERDKDQIAGHDADEKGRRRLFFEDPNLVFKLYDPNDARGKKEWEFYEDVKVNCPEILGKVIPNYYRSEVRMEEGASEQGHYLVMENIFKAHLEGEPCLADIKIGKAITKFDRKTVPIIGNIPGVQDLAKDAYARAFTPGLGREGFQLLGIKVKNMQTGEFEKYGKSLGRSDHILGVEFIVEKFLSGANVKGSPYQKKVIEHLIRDLNVIEKWLSTQTRYKFRGSSLVLAYLPPDDNKMKRLIVDRNSSVNSQTDFSILASMPLAGTDIFDNYEKPLAVVRLIDFNNFEMKNEIDQESLFGVQNLRKYFYEQMNG